MEDMDDAMWAEAHKAYYSLELTREMGGPTDYEVPTLQSFYNMMMDAIDEGQMYGWTILKDDEYAGHAALVKRETEWEVGVAVVSQEDRGRGLGIRAGLHALRFAFEELGAKQIIAFAYNPNGIAKGMIERIGFRPFLNFLMLPIEVWEEKWARRKD